MNKLTKEIQELTEKLIETNHKLEEKIEKQRLDFKDALLNIIKLVDRSDYGIDVDDNIARHIVKTFGISQMKVASLIGATQPHLSLWVNGKVDIPQQFIPKLEALNQSLSGKFRPADYKNAQTIQSRMAMA
jgi:DNA-binding transcriptional regulator YdaS (Cro superfamily)